MSELAPRIEAQRLATLPFTDFGNAERLVDVHGGELRYVPAVGWHVWDGRRWARDEDGAVVRRMKLTLRAMQEAAAKLEESKAKDDLWKHARASESRIRVESAIALARTEERVIARPEDLDTNPYLLTVANGTLDLRTGELRDHDPGDLITKLAPVEFDSEARDERWERFLLETVAGDVDLLTFLQRFAGYCLTGDTGEEVLFFAHGPEATGKSTFLEALKGTWGEYARTADFETFLRGGKSGGPRSGLAELAGARLVIGAEVDDGRSLAEGLVKMLTGGDTIRASFLYRDSFEYSGAFKLCLAANHAPAVSSDAAMWRRIRRVPFEQHVPAERRDRTLKQHLKEPSTAILAWAVKGCLAWQAEGLVTPLSVKESTAAYRDEMDPLAEFVEESCVLGPDRTARLVDLFDAYRSWADGAGERDPLSRKAFSRQLRALNCHNKSTGKTRIWTGIALQELTR